MSVCTIKVSHTFDSVDNAFVTDCELIALIILKHIQMKNYINIFFNLYAIFDCIIKLSNYYYSD